MGALGNANHITLTDQQKARIDDRIAELKGLLESQHYAPGFDESNPDHRLFFQAFDGTGNDRDNVPDDGRRTNPDILQELVPWTQTVRSEYRSGVGTDGGIDKLNYPGGGGAMERAEEAYKELGEQARAWQKENPDVDIYISLAGFSRGSGTARHFANLVYERGVPAEDAQATRVLVDFEHNGHDMVPVYETTYDKYVVAPGEAKLDTMLLYETVVTGQSQNLNLEIPPVKDLKVLHLTATDELRDQFDAQSIIDPDQGFDPRLYEFGLPGAHGDLGGGYSDNWLSSRYLDLGHVFLKQNGVPLEDIPLDYQAAPGAAGVIHDPDRLYYTTFGSREINYSDNNAVEWADSASNQWLQENVLTRLEYIDKAYTGARGALEWARTHPHEPEAAGILAREAELERDLARLSEAKEQIFRSSDLSLETMAAYNQRFAEVQSEADRRMHEKEYAEDAATVPIFNDAGDLDAAFVQSFNNAETVAEFFQSNEGLQLSDAGDDEILQSEYAAFVYNKALTEAAARTGVDAAKILDLDVPGNPDAPGYHYQEARQDGAAVSMEALANLLGTSETEVRKLVADGELGPVLEARQATADQSGGVQHSIYGAADLIRGLGDGDALDIAAGLGRLGLGVDRLQDGFEAETGWLDDSSSAGLQAGLSAAAFVDDVLKGDELGAISSGGYLVDHLGATFDDPNWQGFTDHAAVGSGLSALSLYHALDSGDGAAIAGTGVELANSLSQGAVAEQLSGISGLPEAAPYASYLMAGVQLIEGDVEEAGVTALGGYLMSTGHPVAVGIGAALSVFGGSLIGNETPRAWADFRIDEDGAIVVDVDSNGTGGGLVGSVSSLAEGLAPLVDNVRSYGVEIQPGYLPRIGIRGNEFYLEHGGATRLVTDPQAELPLLLEMNIIGHWMIENDIELWSRSGRHVYLGDTDWSHTVRGTGVFAGGGQTQHAPVTIDTRQIVSLNDPTLRTVARQLAEVTRTWRADKGLFAGEGGALLAVGLGAGLVQYSEIAEAVSGAPDPVSLLDHEETAVLVEATGIDNIIGAGHGPIETGVAETTNTVEFPNEPDISYAPFYADRRSSVYEDALERFDSLDLLPIDPESANETSGDFGSLPVFGQSGDAADQDEAALRIRALADDEEVDTPPPDPVGDGGNGGGFAPESDSGAGKDAPLPVSHMLSMVEDRYLVTSTSRLVDEDEAFLALGGTRNGVVALRGDGDIRFTPPSDFHGQSGFEYQVRNADGVVETRWVAVTVTGQNDRPEARDNFVTELEDQPVLLNRLLANDHDVDGDFLRIVAISRVSTGTVENDAAGGFRYIPPGNFTGEVQLSYVVEDPAGARAAARTTLAFEEAENDPPVVESVVLEHGLEDQAFTFHQSELLARAHDPEGGTLSIQSITAVEGGAVDWDRDSGEVTLIPEADFHGLAEVEFVVADPEGMTTTGTAGIELENVPDPFTAGSTRLSFDQNQKMVLAPGDLLPRLDVDNPDAGEVDIVAARMVPGMPGWVSHQPDGSVQWIPPEDYSGESAFEVRLFNGVERIASRIDLDIAEVNDPPQARPDRFDAVEDHTFELSESDLLMGAADVEGDAIFLDAVALAAGQGGQLDHDTETGQILLTPDPDGDALRLTAVRIDDPAAGQAALLEDGGVRLLPESRYTGAVSLEYDVADGTHTHTAVAALRVQPTPGEPPRVTGAMEDQVFEFHVDDLPMDDVAAEDGSFELTAIRVVDPDTGTLGRDRQNGELVFTPAPDFFGESPIEYTLAEAGTDRKASGAAVIVVEGVDDPPQVTDKDLKEPVLNLDEDQSVVFSRSILLDKPTDIDGEVLSIVDARMLDGVRGTVSLTTGGDVRFEPAPDYHGEAPFEIDVSDGNTTASATITPMLWPINDAPRVQDDYAVMDEDTTLGFSGADLLANDYDIDGPHEALRIIGPWATSAGAAHYDAGADEIRYTPPANQTGKAWVDYLVEDGEGAFSVARLNVSINNVYDPVQAVDDVVVVQEDTDHLFEASVITANDWNPDQSQLEIVDIDDADFTHGQISLTAEGLIDYRSEADYAGEQTFTYTVQDESGHRSSAAGRFIVEEVNDEPRIDRTNEQMLEDSVQVFALDELLANVSDVEDDWMQVVAARSTHGTVDFDAPGGEITFTPVEHLNTELNGGPLLFEYLVRDEKGAETWGAVDFDVEPVNDPPQASDDLLFAWESGPGGYINPVTADALLANDVEVDGEPIRIDQVASGTHGTVTLNTANRTLDYFADPGFIGQDTFAYRVTDDVIQTDGTLSADIGTVTVQVLENHAPVTQDFSTVAAEDTVLDFGVEDFMAHVDDEDLGVLELPENHRVVAVNDAVNGQASLGPNGGVHFVPTADYNSVQHGGVASFSYVVEDIVGNRSEATASITYTPVNDAPVAVGDVITQAVYEEQVAFINIADLLANDYDVDDNPGETTVAFGGLVDSRSAHGIISVEGDQIRYQGDVHYFGGDSFQYRIIDGDGGEDTGTVYLDITNVNDAPVVEFDAAQADDSGYNTLVGLLNNDYDVDGDTLRIVNPSHGSVVNNGTGIRFNAENRGHDYDMTITYGVTDGQETVQSRVDVQVIHVNRPPTSLTQIQTDADSVFVAGNDPDTPDPVENWLGGTVSFMGHSWNAEVGTAAGSGAGQNGLFIDLRNQFNHPVDWPNPTPAAISGTGTFSYTIGVSDGENEVRFNGSIQTPVSLRNINFMGAPVIIDLNDDGLELQGPEESGAAFDWNGDEILEGTGWIAGEGDAILAYDNDGDGYITRANEISFIQYLDDARTDLEGLRAFDSNEDGMFDARDDEWTRFGIWVDDGDAVSESGELIGMEQSGIESLSLSSDEEAFDTNDNHVFGMAEVVYSDGTTGQAGDVAFATIPGSPERSQGAPEDHGDQEVGDNQDSAPTTGTGEEGLNADPAVESDTNQQEPAGPVDEVDEPGTDNSDTADTGTEVNPSSYESSGTSVGASSDKDFDLPTDEELDWMAQSDNAQAAAAAPEEEVVEADVNAALNDPGIGTVEAKEPEEAALAA